MDDGEKSANERDSYFTEKNIKVLRFSNLDEEA